MKLKNRFKKLDNKGYTAVELLAVILAFSVLSGLFVYVLRQNAADSRDLERKRDLSAIYFSLESNKTDSGYPQKLTIENLVGIDPEALADPTKKSLGDPGAEYRYFPADCTSGFCKEYELKVNLEKEAEFTKKSGQN